MKKTLALLALLALAACGGNESPKTLGIGVYPGNPAENFSPTLEKGSGYRNIALLRAARHSSSANYEQTAQLVTDGLYADGPAPWVEVFRNGEKLSNLDGSYLTDQNHAGIVCQGPEVELELVFHGFEPPVDRILVAMDRGRFQGTVLTVEGKDADGAWQPLGTATPSRQQENKLIIHGPEFSLPVNGSYGAYRFRFENAPDHCPVSEVFFYWKDAMVDVLPSARFVSSWKSAGAVDEWVSVDLGEQSSFDKMCFSWINGPLKATVQASKDGKAWKDIASFEGAEPEIKFSRAKGRYVRLCLSGTENGEPFELSEWEVYGKGGTKAVPKAAPAREGARQLLSGGDWKLQRAPQVAFSGEEISNAAFDDAGWLVATVPGTVLGTYVDNGAVPHPNFADNQLFISDSYFRSDFWYRNVFQAHPDTPCQLLHFEGINYQAIVYLNGSFLGVVDGAFRTADFDVTGILADGENTLAVQIIHNLSYGTVKEQTAYTPQSNGGILGGDNPTMHATIGWDWIPTVRGRDIGIYDDVWLSYTGPVTIEDPFVRTELPLPDTTKATLFAQAVLVNHSDSQVSGTLEWSFGDLKVSQPVEMVSSEETVVFEPQTLENPRLWWPKGYGEQNLYPVSFRFIVDGEVSDTKEFQSGVRQMDYSMDEYTPLQGFQAAFEARNDAQRLSLYVNGRRFIGFGGNWGFPEHLLNYRAREFDAAVKYHADMNFTMIRNWVGMTGQRAFYEACDKYGIMVWQDFWLANPWDGPDPLDPDRFNLVAEEYVRRIRNHPSIGLYVGRNEGYPPEVIDSFLKEMIAQEHPGMCYIPHSATDGVSGGGPYNALKPAQYFRVRGRDKFHSEMGMPAVMNYENMVRAMGKEALKPVNTLAHPNPMYGLHDYTLGRLANSAQQAESFNELIANAFGEPADAKKFAELAQWVNYDGYRAMFESRGEYRRGLLLWMSHPAWPSMVWQTYDYYFEPIGAYFGCKKACEPLHIQLNLLTRNVEVVNYHAGDRTGLTARVSVLDMDGQALDGYEVPVEVAEDSTAVLAALPVPDDVTPVYYVKLELADAAGAPVSTNFYVQGKEEGNLQALNGLGKASVKASMTGNGPWKVTLTNNGDVPALMLRLKLVSGRDGEMVLPVIYSDNYFALLPGESRTIDIEADPMDLRGRTGLEVSGFNLDRKRL